MESSVSFNLNQLRDYSSLFSRSEVNDWINGDFNSLNIKISRYRDSLPKSKILTYLDFIQYAYRILEARYQNEYIYKNTFLSEWLVKEIGQTDTVVFSEFRTARSIADLAMFNGVSRAFEIKTDFDSDSRLAGQIEDYNYLFNEVYLIVSSSKIANYEKYTGVGIIVFDQQKERKFEVFRNPVIQTSIDPDVLMETIRSYEYKEIVHSYFGELPKMNSFNQYSVCLDLIKSIPSNDLNNLFIESMKKRKLENVISARYYKELNQLCLALKLKREEKISLINNLKRTINI